MKHPDLQDVRRAAETIRPWVLRTPVFRSDELDEELGAAVFFKCENLQNIGAFKARGAVNTVLSLDGEEAARGVVTHSSGNHATATAYAATVRGIDCVVVMPESASPVKVENARRFGAEIVFCERQEREATADRLIAERGLTLVHPFADPRIIAGQGTAALELFEQAGELDVVIAPVGGGGLIAGTAITVGSMRPLSRVWGAEPLAVDDAARSLAGGVLQPGVTGPATWSDGLLTGLGEINFEIVRERGVEVLTVEENDVVEACWFFLRRMRIVVEPSAATVLAALRSRAAELKGLRIGAILSGGNSDFRWMEPGASPPVH